MVGGCLSFYNMYPRYFWTILFFTLFGRSNKLTFETISNHLTWNNFDVDVFDGRSPTVNSLMSVPPFLIKTDRLYHHGNGPGTFCTTSCIQRNWRCSRGGPAVKVCYSCVGRLVYYSAMKISLWLTNFR